MVSDEDAEILAEWHVCKTVGDILMAIKSLKAPSSYSTSYFSTVLLSTDEYAGHGIKSVMAHLGINKPRE